MGDFEDKPKIKNQPVVMDSKDPLNLNDTILSCPLFTKKESKEEARISYEGELSEILEAKSNEELSANLYAMFGGHVLEPEAGIKSEQMHVLLKQIYRKSMGPFSQISKNDYIHTGGILIMIKGNSGHVFGVYLDSPITRFKECDERDFLFSLTQNIKLLSNDIRYKPDHHYICLDSDQFFLQDAYYGLRDLFICDQYFECNEPTIFTRIAPGYQPIILRIGTLCGTPGLARGDDAPFQLEVYKVTII